MQADAKLERHAGQVADLKAAALVEQVERHRRDLLGMVGLGIGQTTHHHVRVTDGFHLVNVVVAHDGRVKAGVQVVEEINDLHGRAVRRDGREADDVWRGKAINFRLTTGRWAR